MACGWDCYGCKFHELSRNDHTITGCHVTFAKLPWSSHKTEDGTPRCLLYKQTKDEPLHVFVRCTQIVTMLIFKIILFYRWRNSDLTWSQITFFFKLCISSWRWCEMLTFLNLMFLMLCSALYISLQNSYYNFSTLDSLKNVIDCEVVSTSEVTNTMFCLHSSNLPNHQT